MSEYAYITEVKYWLDHYAQAGVPDKNACETYLECESDEKLRSLRLQLQAVADGKVSDETLIKIIGKGRKGKHGSFERWAKLMNLWLHIPKH
jgi:hypothetical protein